MKTHHSSLITHHVLLLLFSLLLVGCGRAGDPVPPRSRSFESTQLLEVAQRGDRLRLRWPRPNLTNPETSGVSRLDIYRLAEETGSPRPMREEIFLEQAEQIGFLTAEQITASQGPFLEYEDPLDATDTSWRTQRFRYAIRYTDRRNRLAPLSNFAFVSPSATVPSSPTELRAKVTQDAVLLEWTAPKTRLDGGEPLSPPAYNVYRRAAKDTEFGRRPLNPVPLAEPRLADTKFRFKAEYVYIVRSVTDVRGDAVESDDSAEIAVTPIDDFRPSKPQNVTGASAGGVVSLFWPTNPESDIKGYVVYRAEKSDSPTWTKLTPSPIPTTTHRDVSGENGKIYLYKIAAVDAFDNESDHSEPVSVEVAR